VSSPLYQFCPPDRIDILEKNLIRLSPTNDFNDPFDGNPHLTPFNPNRVLTQAEFDSLRKVVLRHEPGMSDEDIHKKLKTVKRTPESDKQGIEQMRILMAEMGVLCLTKNFTGEDSLLMWAHYAYKHMGFAIEFNTGSPFFAKEWNRYDLTRSPCDVVYQNERPSLAAGQILDWSTELFFTKSKEWFYETEVRLLIEFKDAAVPDLKLFYIPAESFKRVILGLKSPPALAERLRKLRERPDYRNLVVEQVVLDEREYKLHTCPV